MHRKLSDFKESGQVKDKLFNYFDDMDWFVIQLSWQKDMISIYFWKKKYEKPES